MDVHLLPTLDFDSLMLDATANRPGDAVEVAVTLFTAVTPMKAVDSTQLLKQANGEASL